MLTLACFVCFSEDDTWISMCAARAHGSTPVAVYDAQIDCTDSHGVSSGTLVSGKHLGSTVTPAVSCLQSLTAFSGTRCWRLFDLYAEPLGLARWSAAFKLSPLCPGFAQGHHCSTQRHPPHRRTLAPKPQQCEHLLHNTSMPDRRRPHSLSPSCLPWSSTRYGFGHTRPRLKRRRSARCRSQC